MLNQLDAFENSKAPKTLPRMENRHVRKSQDGSRAAVEQRLAGSV
jgi:hypothetical protein